MLLPNEDENNTSLGRPKPQIPKTLTASNAMSGGVRPLGKSPGPMPTKEQPKFKSGLDLVHSPEHIDRYNAQHRDIGSPYKDKGIAYGARRLFTNAGAEQAKMLNTQNQGLASNYASEQAFFKEGDASLPPLNPKAPPAMNSNSMPAVNLAETATQMPGYTSPQQTSQLREQKAAQPNLPYLPEQPALENGVPSFDDRYMKQNYSGLNRQANESRYMKNFQDAQNQDAASAAMVNRINRGTAAIKDLNEYKSGTGQYAQPQQGGGLPFVGRRPDKAPKLPEPRSAFTNDSDFNKRHGAKLAKADAALMNANTNKQRLGNDRMIADNRDQVERERIFAQAAQDQDQNRQAINTAQKAAQQQLYSNNMRAKEYQQRDAIAKNKLGQGKRTPRYNESTDSMGNTISEYGGYFDEGTGQFVPPGASIDKYGNVVVKKTN